MRKGLKKAFRPVTNAIGKGVFKVKKKSPEICLVLGIGCGLGAIVTACRATHMYADDILDSYAADREKIEEAKVVAAEEGKVYSAADERRDRAIAMKNCGLGFVKAYALPTALTAASVGFILASYGILHKRNLGLIAAYTTLDEGFKRYRARVADKWGEEAEREIRTGETNRKGFVKEKNELGEDKVVEKDVTTMNEAMMADFSDYGRLFAADTSPAFNRTDYDGTLNECFLKAKQEYFNQLLQARGYVFLSEVYRELGFEVTPASVITGWIKNSAGGDNYISFGIRGPVFMETGEHVMNTGRIVKTLSGQGWFLDFNVDGVIWNLI